MFGMFGMGSSEVVVILVTVFILGILPLVLTIWALVDILKNEFTEYNKVIWVLVVVLVPVIGFILYFFIGRDQKIKTA